MSILVDDMVFGPDQIRASREIVIELRNAALEAGRMDYGLSLSHVVSILATVADQQEEIETINGLV